MPGICLCETLKSGSKLTPFEINRKLYGFSPFPESPEIARYLAVHTKPDDTIAVLGSEPQIYFLAHRHSASGYIYVYPLTEPQPLGPVMRQEFKNEIEKATPEYIVYVDVLSSWCSAVVPGQTEKILDDFQKWWGDYSQITSSSAWWIPPKTSRRNFFGMNNCPAHEHVTGGDFNFSAQIKMVALGQSFIGLSLIEITNDSVGTVKATPGLRPGPVFGITQT